MEDININLFEGNDIVTLKLNDVLKDKRVLICSIQFPHTKITHLYLKHLSECYELYKKYEIDQIFIIDSHNDFWSLAVIDSFFPKLKVILDYDKKFISFLKNKFNKKESVLFLSKNWSYQLLLNNLNIEQFYEQPTEDRINGIRRWLIKNSKNFINKKLNIELIKTCLDQPEYLTFNTRNSRSNYYNKIFFYHDIWPNKKLEEYLQIKKQD
jgi:hypothetical protein